MRLRRWRKENSCALSGEMLLCTNTQNTMCRFLKILKLEVRCDASMPAWLVPGKWSQHAKGGPHPTLTAKTWDLVLCLSPAILDKANERTCTLNCCPPALPSVLLVLLATVSLCLLAVWCGPRPAVLADHRWFSWLSVITVIILSTSAELCSLFFLSLENILQNCKYFSQHGSFKTVPFVTALTLTYPTAHGSQAALSWNTVINPEEASRFCAAQLKGLGTFCLLPNVVLTFNFSIWLLLCFF